MLFGLSCSQNYFNFMKKYIYIINLAILIIIFFGVINCSQAAGLLNNEIKTKINTQGIQAGTYGGYETVGEGGILSVVQIIINAFLSIIGVLLLIYLLTAGYKWMTAHGEEEKVTEAKDTIKRAIVGVIIIVASYAISIFVMSRLEAGSLKGGGGATSATTIVPATPAGGCVGSDCD